MLSLKGILITTKYLYFSYNNGFLASFNDCKNIIENVSMTTNKQTRFEYLSKTKRL